MGTDEETSYKTAYVSFLSILDLKNTDQMKYGSFIKKMGEDFATGWENVTPSTLRMHNMFCPSTSIIKLIMISTRSNEMIMAKTTCPLRMKTVQPLGMYPI